MENLKQTLASYVKEERVVEMTSKMVEIQSYYGIPQRETGVAKYVKSVFDAYDIPCYLKEVADGRCNVIATLDSGVPGKTLMFNAHTDTVEPNGWDDAFVAKVVDGKLFGRGSIDDKGPLACYMEAVLAIKEAGALKKGKIIVTGVLDEEHNSIGTIDIVESGIHADAAIVGEVTNMAIFNCQRGLEWLKFHFVGKAVHGGKQREGINAIAKAVDFCSMLNKTLIPGYYAKKHPSLVEATVNYGVIHGGTQLSTVAGECDVFVDTRFLPSQSYDEVIGDFQGILDQLAAADPEFKCEMSVCEEAALPAGYRHNGFETPVDHPLVTTLQGAIKEVTGEEAKIGGAGYWSDGGLLANYGLKIPCVILGPDGDNLHTFDEYVTVDSLTKTSQICALAAVEFCHS